MTWQPIVTAPLGNGYGKSVLVWNGKQVGEAELLEDYSNWDGESDVPLSWAWTHHSTCSCCHSYMDPQPTKWQPLPKPPEA